MSFAARLIILIMGIGLFLWVFELVRKKKFREELSIIWLFIAVIIMAGSQLDKIIDPIATRIGIHYPPVLVFMIIIFFLIVALLYFSLVTSDLKNKVKELTQKMALLEYEIEAKKDK